MNQVKRNTLKVLVMIALFCPAAFADGDMGGGGLADSGDASRAGKTIITRTTEDGDMGGGGLAFDPTYIRSVMGSIYDYLDWMM